ncbi:hypothetical protein N8I77_000955 [Diaporthe amygdali]|nr:hypothetical protein N8I77_000955 [Diaporthe amygdali]
MGTRFRVDVGAFVVLSAINQPLDNGDNKNNAESNDGVVHVCPGNWLLRRENKEDSRQERPSDTDLGRLLVRVPLMTSGPGPRNMDALTRLVNQPSHSGILKARVSGNILRPRMTLIAGGMAYVTPRATTLAAVIALKALEEPKKTQPKMMTQTVVQIKALRGTSSPLWTLAKIRLAGSPRSRANA